MPTAARVYGPALRERFGRNLRKQMERRQYDNNTLAAELGISRQDVWRYTQGLVMPAWDRYAELCAKLRVDPAVLLKDL